VSGLADIWSADATGTVTEADMEQALAEHLDLDGATDRGNVPDHPCHGSERRSIQVIFAGQRTTGVRRVVPTSRR
jgi:hypothetical protein